MGSKGQPAQLISRGKAYQDTKEREKKTISPPKYKYGSLSHVCACCWPMAQARLQRHDDLLSWGNGSHSFGWEGIIHSNYIFKNYLYYSSEADWPPSELLKEFVPSICPSAAACFPVPSSPLLPFGWLSPTLSESEVPLNNLPSVSLDLFPLFYL